MDVVNTPVISIYVPTYNHENYITRALDSILMQQTNCPYEVYVGEDCSTDNTRNVLKDWEQTHPDSRFHILYRKENMGRGGIGNSLDLRLRCKGKYLICLEGDDFWTDPAKLQTQVDFLENHPDYYAVAHNCVVVDADSQPTGETYPECKDETYTFRHFVSEIMPGQYATWMTRNYMIDPHADHIFTQLPDGPGDRRFYFSALCYGKVHCIQKVMSAYRHIVSGSSSFSATHTYRYAKAEVYQRGFLEFAYRIGNPQAIKYAEMLYLRNIRYASRKHLADAQQLSQDKKRIQHPLRAAALLLKRDINYRILHRTLHV